MAGEKFYFIALVLCALMAAVFVAQESVPGFTGAFVLDAALLAARPWTLVTAIFLHGSVTHLLSNLFALGLFGSILEKLVGARRFLALFFGTGIIASAAAAAFYPASLGASGAIFGVLGTLAALRPKMVVWTYGVPMPMFAAAAFWFVLDLAGVFFPGSIANMAHIAGLAAGAAAGLALRKDHREPLPDRKKPLRDEELDDWEEEWM